MVGAGIFALPALLYASAGSFSPLAILVFGVFYACLMAIPAKLSTVFRQSGGAQLYAQHAFGPFIGFQVGWFVLAANMAARAANFHVLVSYLAAVFPIFDDAFIRLATITVLIATFMMISIAGTKRSIGALWVGTAIKLIPILILCIVGLLANGLPNETKLPQFSEIESVALLIAYAFSGAGTVTVAAGEAKEPRSVIYRSILLNLAMVALFYAFVQLAYISIAPDPSELDSPLAAAGESLFGPVGTLMISIAAIFSIGTNQLNSFVAMPRIAYGMARRGLLPNLFAYVSAHFQTPAAAIATYSLIVAGLALSGTFTVLATLGVAVEQLAIIAVIGAFIRMWMRNDGGLADSMGIRWFFIVPVAITLVAWLTMQVPAESLLATLAMVVVGIILFLLSKRGAVEHEGVVLPKARS